MVDAMAAIDTLRQEYSAEDGTFLYLARIERTWDREAFNRLQQVMREVCEELTSQDRIERWIADAFWYIEGFVREDLSFIRPEPPEYFEEANRRVFDLSAWLFNGENPHLPEYDWLDL
jgi:hypothetical protein